MKILFSLEPLYELNSPFIMDTWVQWFARMHAQLGTVTPDYQAKLLAFDSISYKKSLYFQGDRVLLSQADMRNNGMFRGNICRKIEHGVIDTGRWCQECFALLIQVSVLRSSASCSSQYPFV
jgi:hypothetical protein